MGYKNPEDQKQYQREYYHANKERLNKARYARRVAERKKIREFLNETKSVKCFDCKNEFPPYVMDFDHVSGKKLANVGNMVGQYTLNKIKAEIEKCEVVCANCHRIRTHGT